MNPRYDKAIEIVQLLNLAAGMAARAGISIARFNEMREAGGGNLSPQQIQQLAAEADEALARL